MTVYDDLAMEVDDEALSDTDPVVTDDEDDDAHAPLPLPPR